MASEYDWFVFSIYIARAHKRLMESCRPRAKAFFSDNPDAAARAIEPLAEAMAVNDGVVPPRYNTFTKCSNCGEMPCPDEYPTETDRCPWCDVRWQEVAAKVKSEWEESINGENKNIN